MEISVTCVVDDAVGLSKGKAYNAIVEGAFYKIVNDMGKAITCPQKYFTSQQEIPISNYLDVPFDLADAINTFGKYGVVIRVGENNSIYIVGNGSLNLPEPHVLGHCDRRKKQGVSCYEKCDECGMIDIAKAE